jgi:hypothetical protein
MNTPDNFQQFMRRLRWCLFLYYPGLILLAFTVIGLGAYGLAHANDQGFVKFFGIIGLGLLILGAPPLSLLADAKSDLMRAIQVLATIELFFGFCMIGYAVFYSLVQPKLWEAEFKYKTRGIEISKVSETPYVRADLSSGETPLGIIATADLVLPNPIALDRNGKAVLDGLTMSLEPYVPSSKDKDATAPLSSTSLPTITFDGRPIEELPGVAKIKSYGGELSSETLPAGVYKIQRVLLLPGLENINTAPSTTSSTKQADNINTIVCKTDFYGANTSYFKQRQAHLAQLGDAPINISFGATMSLRHRLGRVGITKTAQLKYKYEHSAWMQQYTALDLPSCEEVREAQASQKAELEAQAQRESAERDYLAGQIYSERSGIYLDACSDNEAAVRERILRETSEDGKWMPQMPLFRTLYDCTIKTPRIAIFKLLAPAVYLQANTKLNFSEQKDNEDQLCHIIERLHRTRQLDHIEALATLKLPLDCGDKQLWRAGITPDLPAGSKLNNNEIKDRFDGAKTRDDNVRWIKALSKGGVDLCPPQVVDPKAKYPTHKSTLLAMITETFPPEVIDAVVQSGCHPQRGMANKSDAGGQYYLAFHDKVSPALLWTLRRHPSNGAERDELIAKASPQLLARLDRQMQVGASELNSEAYDETNTVFVSLRARVMNNPRLLLSLLRAGAKLNGGKRQGETWFTPFYNLHLESNNDEHAPAIALLDVLSDEQLKQLLNQGPKHIDQVAVELTALRKPLNPKYDKSPLRDYVCRRQALDCH